MSKMVVKFTPKLSNNLKSNNQNAQLEVSESKTLFTLSLYDRVSVIYFDI
jgi:hypothetical protein